MHAHWGDKSGVGSEHTVDGTPYDAELHIVHFNTKYPSPAEAFDQEDGLAVLGIFINIGKEHPEFEKLCKRFQDIQHPFDVAQLEEEVLPTNFLPNNKSYFTYPGSLTTPPLHESVTWVVFKEHIEMSEKQVRNLFPDFLMHFLNSSWTQFGHLRQAVGRRRVSLLITIVLHVIMQKELSDFMLPNL